MTKSQPQALWIYAHPEAKSFNRDIFDAGRAELEKTHTVVTSDLYAMGFNPLLTSADFGGAADAEGTFLERWATAFETDQLLDDVRAEQQKMLEADLVVIQFPLWWYAVPAILKGWIDRVFASGFAFDIIDPETGRTRRYGDGLLVGKRALIVVTAGEHATALGPRGISGDLDSLLFGLTHGVLFYTGMSSLPLHLIEQADDMTPERATEEIERLNARLKGVYDETPTPYRTRESGDYRPARVLRDEFIPGRVDLGIHRTEG
ncbi:flavodoxin family protein [Mycetocola tolaasinivorans]|uniref:Flavodoxin family protein n=1 Tax=Mycetocola tolaasinivorans TaxID=76635 RepID=A0A3L7A5T0_9MICO|nr:NAD(P)H-dependent oxidoreductase [Mycetocola tolaasinivorans]RLP75587.1 flavodoxin family protein [Mycetocola tolaasinivorans]